MKTHLSRLAFLGLSVYVLILSCGAFQRIAWGSGTWWGDYSLKWGVGYFAYILFCVFLAVLLAFVLWRGASFRLLSEKLIAFRWKLGFLRWALITILLILPVWFFQYTPWGLVFSDVSFRLLAWALTVVWLALLLPGGKILFGRMEFLVAILLTSAEFVMVIPFIQLTDHPFSLGWSEGNRIWDYSIMFGRYLYSYPADKKIPVLLDSGRQFVGGLPFIFPSITLWLERFWIGLTFILPYLLLGLAAFRFLRRDLRIWLLASLWVLIFLKQGPIHPPLILGAVMVALAWRAPLWYAIPLVAGAGLLVQASRFTWIFAPAIWIVMLEFASASSSDRMAAASIWRRSILLGLTGLIGALMLPRFINISIEAVQAFGPGVDAPVAAVTPVPVATATPQPSISPTPSASPVEETTRPSFINSVVDTVTSQPLLWYRLLPNSTYGMGILFALLLATGPLLILLVYLAVRQSWKLSRLQGLALVLPLLAFLAVGLVASTKIGGGGDLHNMDMFLIGLMFTAVIALENGGREWLANIGSSPLWIRLILALLFTIPGFQPLMQMRSYGFPEAVPWLRVLTDASPRSTLEMLPADDVTERALETIRKEVALVQAQGSEVLFMDQRQLLTFGYVDAPLVPEYEKKVLMNEALSSNAAYFQSFYADLADQRFGLIISDPLRTPVKDSSYQFGEENNAWVTWVSNPVLCYYEEKDTLKLVNVQLLVPRREPVDCSDQLPLPEELQP